MRILFLLAALALYCASSQCVMNTTYPNRLPYTALPLSYELNLNLASPNDAVNAAAFSGSTNITIKILSITTCLVVHLGSSLSYTNAYLVQDGVMIKPNMITQNQTYDFLILSFSQPVAMNATTSTLVFTYTGVVNQQSATGLFICENAYDPSIAKREDNKRLLKEAPWASAYHHQTKPIRKLHYFSAATEMMYATQFEQSAARQAYPCFDEPAYKAKFHVVINVPKGQGLTVLSNAPVQSQVDNANTTTWNFNPFPQVMSSYLVAWAVGRFDYTEGYSKDGTRIRVYTPIGYSAYGSFALQISIQSLDYFGSKFNFPYASMTSKLDNIAVPGIIYDAMENWGLCTYDPIMLLVDPSDTSRDARQLPAQVVSHELSHQWFGDTVTAPWWSELYLQEGFARFFEYMLTNNSFPEWYVFTIPENSPLGDTCFYDFVWNMVMQDDYTGQYPAIVVPQDQEADSTIFYAKGASVNYYFYTYLGDSLFYQALALQLAKHQYTNPDVDDLMASFDTVAGDVSDNFLSWLMQPSFPKVTLNVNTTTNVLTATQTPIASNIDESQLWWIRMTLQATDANNPSNKYNTYLDFDSRTYTLSLPQGTTWNVYGNANYTTFLVINYDQPAQWQAALSQIASPDFLPIDRQQLSRQVYYLTNPY